MSCNRDPPNPKPSNPNPAQEVIFSPKLQNITHPSIYFNNNPIKQVSSQKHLWIILDATLNFQEHIKNLLIKVNKNIGLLQKLQNILPRGSLLTIFESFVMPHLDYGYILPEFQQYFSSENGVDPT